MRTQSHPTHVSSWPLLGARLPLTWNHLAWRRAASACRHFSGLSTSPGSGGGTSVPSGREGQVGRPPLPLLPPPGPSGPWASLHSSVHQEDMQLSSLALPPDTATGTQSSPLEIPSLSEALWSLAPKKSTFRWKTRNEAGFPETSMCVCVIRVRFEDMASQMTRAPCRGKCAFFLPSACFREILLPSSREALVFRSQEGALLSPWPPGLDQFLGAESQHRNS